MIRLLAETGALNLFRPFPDSETAEIVVVHLASRRVIGLQVKTVEVTRARRRATVNVRTSSFRPGATTCFVVLAWLRDEARFHEEGLLIPSLELHEFARDDGNGHTAFHFHPGTIAQDRLNQYRHALTTLRTQVAVLA